MTSKVSRMDKSKSMWMKMKDQATEYIKDNPDQVESMKEQVIGALKETVDKEAKKEESKIGQEEDDGTKPSKFNKYKADAINALKPQLDKIAAEKEAAAAAAEEYEDENNDVEETTDSITTANENRASTNTTADTHTSSSDDKVQDLVAEFLSMLDDSNLSKKEQKKAVNVFNAAFALKHIN